MGKIVFRGGNMNINLISDFIEEKDIVALVTPFGSTESEENLVFPEELAVKDILLKKGIVVITRFEELAEVLQRINPKIVITDSLIFDEVKNVVPKEINFTSFSILMAKYKGFLNFAINGVKILDNIKDEAKILIAEGNILSKQYEEISKEKIPRLVKEYTKKNIEFEWVKENDFPTSLTQFDLIIQCSGCRLSKEKIESRVNMAKFQEVPFTNYGTVIAYTQGDLKRCVKWLGFNI